MKKFLCVILIIMGLFLSFGCASGSGANGDFMPGNDGGIFSSGQLNNLRDYQQGWTCRIVAADAVFCEQGYFRFGDLVARRIGEEGEMTFARTETAAHGIYTTPSVSYAFAVPYAANGVSDVVYAPVGLTGSVQAGGEYNGVFYSAYGKSLVAFDSQTRSVSTCVYSGELRDFRKFNCGNAAVTFDDAHTYIYVYEGGMLRLSKTLDVDLSNAESALNLTGIYIFGDGEGNVIRAVATQGNATEERLAAAEREYRAYLETLARPHAYIEDGTVKINQNGSVRTVTAADIAAGCTVVAAAQNVRKMTAEIVAVKETQGRIFAVVGKEPSGFQGIRDINDGIPPIVVEITDGGYRFAGLVDFTGYSVYRLVLTD